MNQLERASLVLSEKTNRVRYGRALLVNTKKSLKIINLEFSKSLIVILHLSSVKKNNDL